MNIQIVQRRGQRVRMQNDGDNFDDDDVDPDLHNEVEIHFTSRETQCSAKSRQTMSRKSSSKKSETENSVPSRIVKSRGRPMKPHETEPFLSIDNLPADKTFVSEKSGGSSTRPPVYRTVPPPRSPTGPRTAVFTSPYTTPRPQTQRETIESDPLKTSLGLDLRRCQSAGSKSRSSIASRSGSRQGSRPGSHQGSRPGSRSQPSRTGRVTPANSLFISPTKQLKNPNHHVKSPFKHAVYKPEMVPEGRATPSQDLKDRTTQAQFYINRLISMTSDKEPPRTAGRLKKGKLKPLYPVTVEGPRIERCRGIVSEARSYGASPSRTLQRRIHLMNTIPNVHEYLLDHRPCTTESVHQTSVASSDGEVANMREVYDEENMDSNRSIPDKEVYDIESGLDQGQGEVNMSPVATNEELSTIKGPDFESKDSSIAESPTPRMFATELGTRSPQDVNSDLTIPPHLQQFTIEDPQDCECATDSQTIQQPTESENKDTKIDENRNNDGAGDDARKARSISPSKSVRFAEEKARQDSLQQSKEMKQQKNVAKQQKERQGSADVKKKKKKSDDNTEMETHSQESVKRKNKQNAESCKTDDINEIFRKDDDDDKDNDKNKHKSNQNDSESANKGSSGTNQQEKSTESKSEREHSSEGQGQHRSRNTKPRSQSPLRGQNCSKFYQSSASKPHKNILQVQTVIHGDSAQNMIGPESPSRPGSHRPPHSPSHRYCVEQDPLAKFYNFPNVVDSAEDRFDYYSQRSKVKFKIEGEEPQVDTIFMEDENSIGLLPDRDITFEAIESELQSLRHVIHNKLFEKQVQELNSENERSNNVDTESEKIDADKGLIVEGRNPSRVNESTVDTGRTEYSDLIEKYRKKCMDQSEFCGAFSDMLTTPRKQYTYAYLNDLPVSCKGESVGIIHRHTEDSFNEKQKSVENSSVAQISDSGVGSVDNISEISRSASMTISEVPRLDLGDATSDLDLDSEYNSIREEKNDEADVTITNEDEFEDGKNILEMVCDDLPLMETKQEKLDRKQTVDDRMVFTSQEVQGFPEQGSAPCIRKMLKSHKIKREEDMSNLKVVATTKCLSKPPQEKLTMSRTSNIPFPPLCFTINARPPTGYLYYFAYGSDMNPNRFSNYIKREVEERYWALLFGFSLIFNKKGSSPEAGGFANLEFNPLRSVEGCMYKITPQELEVLDKCVGYPEHYEHLVLPVWFSNSKDPENYGVCQYCVPALTYIAQNEWTETETPLSYDYSLSQCIKSADICTQEYRESLLSMTKQIQASA